MCVFVCVCMCVYVWQNHSQIQQNVAKVLLRHGNPSHQGTREEEKKRAEVCVCVLKRETGREEEPERT